MKRRVSFFLCFAVLLTLTACSAPPAETPGPAQTHPTEPADAYDYPDIKEKLTWDAINAFPIKTSDMTVEEMRQVCLDFFRFTKTALWTPNADLRFIRNNQGKADEILKGTVYGGLPYVSSGCGSVYRMMDYLDEETGVLDITRAAKMATLFGNQCGYGAYWAWGRIMNSAKYDSTIDVVVANNFLRVGPYTYDDKISAWSDSLQTTSVCQDNGEQVMYQSYAAMQPADGLVYYTSGGHILMCSAVPHVEYVNGTDQIDGEKSYLLIVDQHQEWAEGTNEAGDKFLYKNYIDQKLTFQKLFKGGYLPFTFKELTGEAPIEETECTFSFTGDTITVSELFSGVVTSNYGISDIYAIVKNAAGEEVYRHAVRVRRAGTMELELLRMADNMDKWGTLNVSSGEFTVEVIAQLATGERPTVYTGKLVP